MRLILLHHQAGSIFVTAAPNVYAAEDIAVVAEIQDGAQASIETADVFDVLQDFSAGAQGYDKDSGWARILTYILDSIFG